MQFATKAVTKYPNFGINFIILGFGEIAHWIGFQFEKGNKKIKLSNIVWDT